MILLLNLVTIYRSFKAIPFLKNTKPSPSPVLLRIYYNLNNEYFSIKKALKWNNLSNDLSSEQS